MTPRYKEFFGEGGGACAPRDGADSMARRTSTVPAEQRRQASHGPGTARAAGRPCKPVCPCRTTWSGRRTQ